MSQNFQFKYYSQLDGLRGIAVLLVMLFHAKFSLFGDGYIGGDIFFVLSGFLITSLLIKEFNHRKSINLKKFYIRRIRRLFPALIFFLVVYLTVNFIILGYSEFNENIIDSIIALFYMTNWVQALGYREFNLLNHTWSLSLEEQFYLIFPVFMYFLLNRQIRVIYILGIYWFLYCLWG